MKLWAQANYTELHCHHNSFLWSVSDSYFKVMTHPRELPGAIRHLSGCLGTQSVPSKCLPHCTELITRLTHHTWLWTTYTCMKIKSTHKGKRQKDVVAKKCYLGKRSWFWSQIPVTLDKSFDLYRGNLFMKWKYCIRYMHWTLKQVYSENFKVMYLEL